MRFARSIAYISGRHIAAMSALAALGLGCAADNEVADVPILCAGEGNLGCAVDSYCRERSLGSACPGPDVLGECALVPDACAQVFDPVCGCDGMTYGNACEAAAAGVAVATEGECG